MCDAFVNSFGKIRTRYIVKISQFKYSNGRGSHYKNCYENLSIYQKKNVQKTFLPLK